MYWAVENHRVFIEKELNLPGVTVWCGMSTRGIIGPSFFHTTVTGASYVSTLDNDFWPLVQNDDSLYFQQDGESPHYSS